MVCCGKRRSTLSTQPTSARPSVGMTDRLARAAGTDARMAAPKGGAANAAVTIRYVKTGSIVVRGVATGRRYTFSAQNTVQVVDQKDVAAMLRTGLFRR